MQNAVIKKVDEPIATKSRTPRKRASPIPANVAAIWGAFIYEGMLACSQGLGRDREVLRKWGMGCDDLIAAACAYLPEVWRQIEPRWYEKDFPGVFEYEVISPLGVGLGDYLLLNNGQLPPRDFVQEAIQELIQDFFRSERNFSVPDRTALGQIGQ